MSIFDKLDGGLNDEREYRQEGLMSLFINNRACP